MAAQSQGRAASPESVITENGYVFRFRSRINGRPVPSPAALFAEYRLPPSLFSGNPLKIHKIPLTGEGRELRRCGTLCALSG